jgi:putrescine aminotransferase
MSVVPKQVSDWDEAHLVHPWSFPGPSVLLVKGQGSRYWDASGREYLDALGSIQLCEVGHGRRELAEAASEQIATLEYAPMHWNFTNEPASRLAHRLVELAPDMQSVFFASSGSEACDSAVKLARFYHYLRGEPTRTNILTLNQSYHGATYGATAATGIDSLKVGFGELPEGFIHLTPPYPYHQELFDGKDPVEYCVDELEETVKRLGANTIAAFIGEPVLTVGGVIVPPKPYWAAISEICHRHGILMIADEVVTAFGRLGAWFASKAWGLDADMIMIAKGVTSGYVPLSGVLLSGKISKPIKEVEDGLPHGFTYNGHAVACAVALKNLDIIEEEQLCQNATKVGEYLVARLQEELSDLPVVGEVRGAGLLAGVELVADRDTRAPLVVPRQAIADRIRDEEGVIVRSIAQNVIIAPCLVLTEEEADWIATALKRVLETTGPDGRPTGRKRRATTGAQA